MKKRWMFSAGLILLLHMAVFTPHGFAQLDIFGPPSAEDPSTFTGPFIGLEFAEDFLATLPPANEEAFEGGPIRTFEDAGINNSVAEGEQMSANVPTNGRPSPLFGAASFTQQMLRFEEFGPEALDPTVSAPADSFPVPMAGPTPEQDPTDFAKSAPAGSTLETFLALEGIAPFPMQSSNDIDENPWKLQIENFLGRPLDTPPAEGRPPGKGWSHPCLSG